MPAPNPETNSEPKGSDPQSLLADLVEAARRRNLSTNSLLAYRRTWTQFVAWASASSLDPRSLPSAAAQEAYGWLGEKKGSATIKQIRAALALAYKHWDLKNPFGKVEPPLQNEPKSATLSSGTSAAPAAPQRPAGELWFSACVPPGERAVSDSLPFR